MVTTMQSDERRTKKRLEELAEQSWVSGCFTFSDFLSPLEASLAYEIGNTHNRTFWGGFTSAERVMVRFGDKEELGYEQTFPICILRISPQHEKFAETLGHRDYLGSLISLGIERSVLGDILIDDGKAYVFVLERMADFIREQLLKVRHTQVFVEAVDCLPPSAGPKLESKELVVASPRLDGVLAKLFGFSRSEAKAAFAKQEVFRNGRLCTNSSVALEEGDTVSVRHHGKFIFRGSLRQTKKGNERIAVELYT